MKSRLSAGIGCLLLVCAANATSILGTNGSTLLVNESTGVATGSSAASNYFDNGTTTQTPVNQDGSGWGFSYAFPASGQIANTALITTGCGASTTFPCGSGWAADNASSSWVGFCNCQATDKAAAGVIFTLGFDIVPAITPANAIITFDLWTSDPAHTTILLNNSPILAAGYGGSLSAGSPTVITIDQATCPNCITAGINQGIEVEINDSAIQSSATGVRVQFIEADDGGTGGGGGAPEPGSIVLMITGMAAVVAGVRRRNKRS